MSGRVDLSTVNSLFHSNPICQSCFLLHFITHYSLILFKYIGKVVTVLPQEHDKTQHTEHITAYCRFYQCQLCSTEGQHKVSNTLFCTQFCTVKASSSPQNLTLQTHFYVSLQYLMKKCGMNNNDMNSYIDFTYMK